MNKSKRPFNRVLAKAIRKEVHQAQMEAPSADEPLKTEQTNAIKLLKKQGSKPSKKEKLQAQAVKRNVRPKKAKSKVTKSKRTTPGLTESAELPPHNVYIEGKRWIKTLQKQTLEQARTLTKKLFRRGSYK